MERRSSVVKRELLPQKTIYKNTQQASKSLHNFLSKRYKQSEKDVEYCKISSNPKLYEDLLHQISDQISTTSNLLISIGSTQKTLQKLTGSPQFKEKTIPENLVESLSENLSKTAENIQSVLCQIENDKEEKQFMDTHTELLNVFSVIPHMIITKHLCNFCGIKPASIPFPCSFKTRNHNSSQKEAPTPPPDTKPSFIHASCKTCFGFMFCKDKANTKCPICRECFGSAYSLPEFDDCNPYRSLFGESYTLLENQELFGIDHTVPETPPLLSSTIHNNTAPRQPRNTHQYHRLLRRTDR